MEHENHEEQSGQQNILSIEVDKRITLGSFKKRLEPWLGTTAVNFKVTNFFFEACPSVILSLFACPSVLLSVFGLLGSVGTIP